MSGAKSRHEIRSPLFCKAARVTVDTQLDSIVVRLVVDTQLLVRHVSIDVSQHSREH